MYKGLGVHGTTQDIRLLCILPSEHEDDESSPIQCEIVHSSLEAVYPYRALSYVWGNVDDGTHEILVDQCIFLVGLNLHSALLQLRCNRMNDLMFWVDAICINQFDLQERNRQVSQMRQVYEKAQEVIVWLGPAADASDLAISFVRELYEHKEESATFWLQRENLGVMNELVALQKLFARPYWSRIWIVQEMMAAKSTLVLCGTDQIDGRCLRTVQSIYFNDTHRDVALSTIGIAENDNSKYSMLLDVYLRGPRDVVCTESALQAGWTMAQLLQYYLRYKKATDPRDMVFALSARFNAERGVNWVDYTKSVAEVYTQLMVNEISVSQRLDILGAHNGKISDMPDLPSWVIDWSADDSQDMTLYDPARSGPTIYRTAYKASRDSKALVRFEGTSKLITEGVFLGNIDAVSSQINLKYDSPLDDIAEGLYAWAEPLTLLKKDLSSIAQDLSQALVADVFARLVGTGFQREAYRALLGSFVSKLQQAIPVSSLPPVYGMCTTHYLKDVKQDDIEPLQQLYPRLICMILAGRRVFTSLKQDAIGIAPDTSRIDDKIFVPFGCQYPVVLRQVHHDTYRMIGPTYVEGFMYGETMDFLTTGTLKSTTVTLV